MAPSQFPRGCDVGAGGIGALAVAVGEDVAPLEAGLAGSDGGLGLCEEAGEEGCDGGEEGRTFHIRPPGGSPRW